MSVVVVFPPELHKTTEVINGKSIPLQAWTGPEDSRRVRFPDFMAIGT